MILRLRSLVEMMTREHCGERVLVVAHQVIVNCMRYLLENLDEAQILAIDKLGDVPNCAVTSYELDHVARCLQPGVVNFVAPLLEAGAQGAHKLARGYLPVPTYSAHWIRDPALRRAVADYLKRERAAVAREIALLGEESPYRKQ